MRKKPGNREWSAEASIKQIDRILTKKGLPPTRKLKREESVIIVRTKQQNQRRG